MLKFLFRYDIIDINLFIPWEVDMAKLSKEEKLAKKEATAQKLQMDLAKQMEPRPKFEIFAKWLMFTMAILFMGLVSAFWPLHGNIPFIVIPSVLVLIFAKPCKFEKIKLTTLVTMRVVIVFAALRLFNPQIYVDLILLALIINILEATFTDLLTHKKYFNAVSGFALAIGVIALKGGWVYGTDFGNFYLVGGTGQYALAITVMYIIAYTLWNWIFVTDEFSPSVSLMHVGFLLAPILGSVFSIALGSSVTIGIGAGMGMWLLLRANTLAIGGWLQIAAKGWFEKEFYNEKFAKFIDFIHKDYMQIIFMIINVGLMIAAIALAAVDGQISYSFPGWTAPSQAFPFVI